MSLKQLKWWRILTADSLFATFNIISAWIHSSVQSNRFESKKATEKKNGKKKKNRRKNKKLVRKMLNWIPGNNVIRVRSDIYSEYEVTDRVVQSEQSYRSCSLKKTLIWIIYDFDTNEHHSSYLINKANNSE